MQQSIKNEKLVAITNISKKYGNKIAIKNFSLDIYPGERIALIGANGSGKSTISEIIGGIRKPTSGTIIKKDKTVIGIQFQDSRYLYGITVMDMIKYYLQTFNIEITKQQLNKMLSTYQILHLTNKMVQNLSGGQQQRLNILLSVIHQPDLVILDEISTGLDIEVREEIFEFLKTNIVEKNVAMILVSHNMSEIERFCTRIIFMNEGEIIEETTIEEIIKIYGCVEKYMHYQLLKYKKQQQVKINIDNAYIKKPQSLVTKTTMNKHTSLLELIAKYFIRGFFVPFFIFIYPILTLFLQGFAFEGVGQEALQKLVVGISIMQIISIGIFFVPQTIIEFKSSVLMKRIGATNVHPRLFVGVIIILGVFFSLLAFLWTLLWAGIFFGNKFGWTITSTPIQLWSSLPWLLLIFVNAIGLGMMMASLLKTQGAYISIANIIYFPIAFLSGGIVSMTLIENSDVLKYIVYIFPFHYCVSPFMDAWVGKFKFSTEIAIDLSVSLVLISVYMTIAAHNLKWQS